MKKALIFVAAFTVSSTAFAADIYTCDGFKYDKEKDIRQQIPDAKFEVRESEFSITIINKNSSNSWFANDELGKRHFKNGNYELMGSVNKKGEQLFGYFNKATKQTVVFANCEPKEDF